MATTIKLKNSVTTTNVPSSLEQGEVAVNVTDKKVWVGNAATTPVQLLGGGADGSFTNISVSSVATFGAGTVSAPSITTTGDTNTGIFFPAADTIAFTEGGVESMRVDSSGNVGIGTSSPAAKLHIAQSTADTRSAILLQGVTDQNFQISSWVGASGGSDTVQGKIGLSYSTTKNSFINFHRGGGTTGGYMSFTTGADTERMRIDGSGNVGIGTSSPTNYGAGYTALQINNSTTGGVLEVSNGATVRANFFASSAGASELGTITSHPLVFKTVNAERMRIDIDGNLSIATTSTPTTLVATTTISGIGFSSDGYGVFVRSANTPLFVNRLTDDGLLVALRQAGVTEGNISVSGSTVSYNGGHLARWSQLLDNSKDESIVKGTVLSNLDEMCVWEKDGVVAENEQLNKMKVSDVEGDTNVAGVFVNWTKDEDYNSDDMNIAMTGDMIIRIAQGVTVQRGDLLMSAGDGTAKPQGDDIVRSKTIAKVTSTNITCTYADGSYCVPCVLMAC